MAKQRKVKISITLEHTMIDDWYEGEGKSPKQKLKLYEEAFDDIETLSNHVLAENPYGYDVKAEYID